MSPKLSDTLGCQAGGLTSCLSDHSGNITGEIERNREEGERKFT